MTKLIICDLFGTLIKADVSDGIIRPGFQNFWEHYTKQGNLFVVSSDGSEEGVKDALQRAGLIEKFSGVYDARHLEGYTGESLKDLARICDDFGVSNLDAVFIGDDSREKDSCSAYCARIRFIQVPQFRENQPTQDARLRNGKTVTYEVEGNPFSFKQQIGKI
jgi:phosphoglycolate phosphatase-like HAD superfamily hydrolase